MIGEDKIRRQLGNILYETRYPGLGERETGKVRDCYKQGGRRIIIATDRVSAFDCVLGTVPLKGQVLNQLAAYWFEKTRETVPNHLLDVPDPNVMVVSECKQLPLEFIVRSYITGVTKTSAWYNYERGVREFCGNRLPAGLRKDQKLDHPILTPTTKLEEHDRSISREEAIGEGLIDAATFDEAAKMCFNLFTLGARHAEERGLILVDTKYELGMLDGRLVFTDEIHTPDSSRYWHASTYEELFAAGKEQRQLDKEYVRHWLVQEGFRGDGEPPALPDDVRIEAAYRYISAYEIITGLQFDVTEGPVVDRITKALREHGYFQS